MNFVEKVKEFNEIAGTPEKFDPKKLSLYIGLVLEEVDELLLSLGPKAPFFLSNLSYQLREGSRKFKQGEFEELVANIDRTEALDAFVDIAVVSLGGAIVNGSDVIGACNEVMESNLSKFPLKDGKRTVLKDENGKVMKPPEYRKPELEKFLK